MEFLTGVFATWLVEKLADTSWSRLNRFFFGKDQKRTLREAADTAVELTAKELWPSDRMAAEHLAMVINEFFDDPGPIAPTGEAASLIQALQDAIEGPLAPLDDKDLTGTGRSAADILGISVMGLGNKLFSNLASEIIKHGMAGDPLAPMANQLNFELARIQGSRIEEKVDRIIALFKESHTEPGRKFTRKPEPDFDSLAQAELYRALPPTPDIDSTRPHSARIWNYWQGGKDHYPVDRRAGESYQETYPAIRDTARAVRDFMARAVRYLAAEAGVRQFIDVGAGLPAPENTHEIAQRVAPECRVAYLDNDALVLAHARALFTSSDEGACGVIEADMEDTATILAQASRTLDLSRPVALLFMEVLGHISDEGQAIMVVRELMNSLAPGSYLALADSINAGTGHVAAAKNYALTGAAPYKLRSPGQIISFFEGMRFIRPGLVSVEKWRPDPLVSAPVHVDALAGVAKSRDAKRLHSKLP